MPNRKAGQGLMICEKDIVTDFFGAKWKILSIENDVVYLECISSWIVPELVGDTDICLLTDIGDNER
jgi:hypothetical protein